MLAIEQRRSTVEDYRRLPPDDWRYQLIEGEIIMAPAPNFFHQTIASNIAIAIGRYLADHPLGRVLFAPLDVYLSDNDVYQPDVLFISRERESIIREDGLHGAPDFVVEILSARTARYDLNAKRRGYARAGVRELWLVFPEAKRVDRFALQENAALAASSHALGETFHSPLFPDLKFRTNEIFAR